MQGIITFAIIGFCILIGSNIIAYLLGVQTPEDYPTEDDEPHPL